MRGASTWKVSGLHSEHKQKKVSDVLTKLNLDVAAGLGRRETMVAVGGYKWFEKPPNVQNSLRGEGDVGFRVSECLMEEDRVY